MDDDDYTFVDDTHEPPATDQQDDEPVTLEDAAFERGEEILSEYGTRWV